jgi:hypothetical protein
MGTDVAAKEMDGRPTAPLPLLPWAPQPDVVRAAQRDAAFVAELQLRAANAVGPWLGPSCGRASERGTGLC